MVRICSFGSVLMMMMMKIAGFSIDLRPFYKVYDDNDNDNDDKKYVKNDNTDDDGHQEKIQCSFHVISLNRRPSPTSALFLSRAPLFYSFTTSSHGKTVHSNHKTVRLGE